MTKSYLHWALAGCGGLLLAGCQSEDQRRAEYRTAKMQECVASFGESPAADRLDTERFCGCVLDLRMAGKTADELASAQPSREEAQSWAVQCTDQNLRPDPIAGGGVPTAPVAASDIKAAGKEAPN